MTPQQRVDVGSVCGVIAVLSLGIMCFNVPADGSLGRGVIFATSYVAIYVFGLIATTLHSRWWLVLPLGLLILTLVIVYYLSTLTVSF